MPGTPAESAAGRPVLLLLCDYGFPSEKAGGPVIALNNLLPALRVAFRVRVVTRGHDVGEGTTFRGIPTGEWIERDGVEWLYLPQERLRLSSLPGVLRTIDHDILYCNSFFSVPFSILPMWLRWLRIIRRAPVFISPRGELASGALRVKRWSKTAYLLAARLTGVYARARWIASSPHEREDIRRRAPGVRHATDIDMLPEVLSVPEPSGPTAARDKISGRLRVAFVARITPVKNLPYALRVLRQVAGDVELHVIGAPEDRAHWDECKRLVQTLDAPRLRVMFHGHLPREAALAELRRAHVMLLPTAGENFGHAIFEALYNGCPVIVSDRTPWRGLEARGAGWDISLDRPDKFVDALQKCAKMTEDEHRRFRLSSARFAQDFLAQARGEGDPAAIFKRAAGGLRD